MQSQWVLYSVFLSAYLAVDVDGDLAAVTKAEKASRWEEKPGRRHFLGVTFRPREIEVPAQ